MAAHAARAARLTAALAAAAFATLAVPAAAAPPGPCGNSTDFETCGATGDGTSYNTVVAIPGLSGGPGGSSGGGSSSGGCVGCEWYVTPACPINGPPPVAEDVMCSGAVMSCPEGGVRMRVFVRRPGAAWTVAGTYCTGNGNGVVTVADVAADAGALYRDRMTPDAATIGAYPPGRVVVNQPAYFAAGGVDTMRGTFGPDGLSITITAVPTYVWDFGDGATLETTSPGGPPPGGDVTHTYRAPAVRTVRLTTRWHAEFTVTSALGTFGPFEVGGAPVAPTTTRAVDVREARAELIAR